MIEVGFVKEVEKLIVIDGLLCVVFDLDIGNKGIGFDVVKLVLIYLLLMIIIGLLRLDILR